MKINEIIKKNEPNPNNKYQFQPDFSVPPDDILIHIDQQEEDDFTTTNTDIIDYERPKITCSICYNDHYFEHMINFNETNHEICKFCYREYLKTEITHNKVL